MTESTARGTPDAGPPSATLCCVECLIFAKGYAGGWRAYLTDEGEMVVYCPDCAEREFGGDD